MLVSGYIIRILCVAIIHIALVVFFADAEASSSCPLWHWFNERSGHCECCTVTKIIYTRVLCHATDNYLEIFRGQCMTWNNVTKDVEVGRCLFIKFYQDMCDYNEYH